MKKLLILVLLLIKITCNAQVGIGTSNPAGALDISSTTQGLLPPRVALTSLIVEAPVTNPAGGSLVAGTLVWNTATSGSIPTNVIPGMYYWSGTKWISLAGSPGGLDWSLSGNTGTNPSTNYVGTTDNVPLILRANSIERIRMGTAETVINEDAKDYDFRVESINEKEMFLVDASTNHVHVRASSPFPNIDMFTAVGNKEDYAINGYATGQNNAAIYGQHQTKAEANAVYGGAFDGSGKGYTQIKEPDTNIGVVGSAENIGVLGTTNFPSNNNIERKAGYFTSSKIVGTDEIVTSVSKLAGYDSISDFYYGGYFDGGADPVGFSTADPAGDIDGSFDSTDYAWVGVQYLGTNYKILGGGSVSTIVKDEENKGHILFAPESPEITFTDSGVGKLVNGICKINIESILANNIYVDEKHPLKVFIQLEGDCNGVYVTEKSANGFTVKELKGGKSNISFSWQLIANRSNTVSKNGTMISKHVDVRLPLAPTKPEKMKQGVSKAPSKIKTK